MSDNDIKELSELIAFLLMLDYFEDRDGEIIFECEPAIAERMIQTFLSDCSTITYNTRQKRIKFKDVHMTSLIWQGLNRDEPTLPQEIWDYIDEYMVGTIIEDVKYIDLDNEDE